MHLDSFIVSALLLLAATSVAVALFRHMGLGSVLGLLVAGVVVGPLPGPYVTAHVDDVRHFTELGVVLLFVIGLEMKPARLWSMRRELFGLGSLQILITGLAITAYVYAGTAQWGTSLLFGLTLALSSTAFVMQLLAERGELASPHGTGTFAILLIQDLALVFGYRKGDAARITFLLAQAGEFGFVLFGSALVLEVIDESVFITAVGVISLSMLLTPLPVRAGNALATRLEKPVGGAAVQIDEIPLPAERMVLIGGYGRMGHTVAALLQSSAVPFIAFDTDPARVATGRGAGQPVLYGDISDLGLLTAAHAERASLIVLTIDHAGTALRAVTLLRDTYPGVPLIARSRDLEASARLLEAGATQAYPETIEASLRLGATALQMVGAPADSVDLLIQGVRARDYELVREGEQGQ